MPCTSAQTLRFSSRAKIQTGRLCQRKGNLGPVGTELPALGRRPQNFKKENKKPSLCAKRHLKDTCSEDMAAWAISLLTLELSCYFPISDLIRFLNRRCLCHRTTVQAGAPSVLRTRAVGMPGFHPGEDKSALHEADRLSHTEGTCTGQGPAGRARAVGTPEAMSWDLAVRKADSSYRERAAVEKQGARAGPSLKRTGR